MNEGDDKADLEAQVAVLRWQLEELWNYVFALHLALVAPGEHELEPRVADLERPGARPSITGGIFGTLPPRAGR